MRAQVSVTSSSTLDLPPFSRSQDIPGNIASLVFAFSPGILRVLFSVARSGHFCGAFGGSNAAGAWGRLSALGFRVHLLVQFGSRHLTSRALNLIPMVRWCHAQTMFVISD